MSPQDQGGIEIGATLRDARRRYGMDVREVEERTKIRARYIRALENEDWETLPAPAYVRGFLRTYGQMLGLDGEMLADEFRRRYGEGTAPGGPGPPEPLLSEPRGPSERPRLRAPLVVLGVIAAVVVFLLLLSLFDGDQGPSRDGGAGVNDSKAQQQKQRAKRQERRRRQEAKEEEKLRREDAELTAISGVQVCLVGDEGALIDNQVLAAGTDESYSGSKRYLLTVNAGSVRFQVGKEKRRLEVSEPASFVGDSKGIREVNYRGPECP
jgi:cytoskeleton protein RodZ